MVETNTPSVNDNQDNSQSESSNQEAANQTLPQLNPVRSRFGRRPEIRNQPYDHLEFVRLADRQTRTQVARTISDPSTSSTEVSDPPMQISSSDSSSSSPEPNDYRSLLESQVPRIGFYVPKISELQHSLDTLRAQGYEFIVLDVAREVDSGEVIPVCDLQLSSTGSEYFLPFYPYF